MLDVRESLDKITIPDFKLQTAGFQLSFRDIKLADAQLPNVSLQFGLNQSGLELRQANLTMEFQFDLQQQRKLSDG